MQDQVAAVEFLAEMAVAIAIVLTEAVVGVER